MKQNNKKGFTLAEMVITTAIIGLISTLMIQTYFINSNSYKNQYAVALKKVYSELSYAAEQIKAENGGTLENKLSLYQYGAGIGEARQFCKYLKCQKICDYNNPNVPVISACFPNESSTAHTAAILNDGTQVKFYLSTAACTSNSFGTNIKSCGSITVDLNGTKAPNTAARDRFLFMVLKDGVVPAGRTTMDEWNADPNWMSACVLANLPNPGPSNLGCAAIVLKQGKMTY
jgi:prepilin-type N-terminal cleavage/methylation domain-containing protein